MRIVIGETTNRGPTVPYRPVETAVVEARVLEIRDPREREGPDSGRVVVLMVPEGYKIPRGADSGKYRTYLRFVARKAAF